MPGNDVIQGLWIGDELSTMERLSIASFLAQGHQYHLYVYRPVSNVPLGTCLKDASEVLPESMIFQYPDYASYAGFANYFRYKLLLERGGWWVDTDAVCLRPFDFADEYVFGSELTTEATTTPTSGFIKAPAGSEAMAFAWAQCLSKDPGRLTWGETGPRLVAEVIRKYSLHAFLQDYRTFTPVAHFEWERILAPGWTDGFPALTCAIHLWNEKWRRGGQDKNALYPSDCLYEQLKAMYLGSPADQGGSVV
jgi:Glycosyltransferase sugar-binding region containing DXD motif